MFWYIAAAFFGGITLLMLWFQYGDVLSRDREKRAKAWAQVSDDRAASRQRKTELNAKAKQDRADAQSKLVCKFCHESGCVTARRVKRAKRLSATRIVGGIASAGGTVAATGVSKKKVVMEMRCSNCNMSWDEDAR